MLKPPVRHCSTSCSFLNVQSLDSTVCVAFPVLNRLVRGLSGWAPFTFRTCTGQSAIVALVQVGRIKLILHKNLFVHYFAHNPQQNTPHRSTMVQAPNQTNSPCPQEDQPSLMQLLASASKSSASLNTRPPRSLTAGTAPQQSLHDTINAALLILDEDDFSIPDMNQTPPSQRWRQ